jgi:hypothetical protein
MPDRPSKRQATLFVQLFFVVRSTSSLADLVRFGQFEIAAGDFCKGQRQN